jgi:carbon monoxide dehydrogenase subunit G
MFVREELALDVGFDAAQSRLASLTRDGSLRIASVSAYDNGLVVLIRVGPLGDVPGVSKLVRVHFRELVSRADSAVLTLRWEATGQGGGLFPALDADITLTPAGEETTRLTLAGAYRPPLAALGSGLDRAILGRVASATIRSLLSRLALAIANPNTSVAWTAVSDAGVLRWTTELEEL